MRLNLTLPGLGNDGSPPEQQAAFLRRVFGEDALPSPDKVDEARGIRPPKHLRHSPEGSRVRGSAGKTYASRSSNGSSSNGSSSSSTWGPTRGAIFGALNSLGKGS